MLNHVEPYLWGHQVWTQVQASGPVRWSTKQQLRRAVGDCTSPVLAVDGSRQNHQTRQNGKRKRSSKQFPQNITKPNHASAEFLQIWLRNMVFQLIYCWSSMFHPFLLWWNQSRFCAKGALSLQSKKKYANIGVLKGICTKKHCKYV